MNAPYTCQGVQPHPMTRRQLLQTVAAGFGWVAFSGVAASGVSPAAPEVNSSAPLGGRAPHFKPRAKRVIFLCMQGGPSHLDTFDYKPQLQRDAGKSGPSRGGGGELIGSPFAFRQHGQSGQWISELFPHVARHADRLCLVRSMHTDIPNHPQAFVQLHTGSSQFIRPSMGAWVLYGLGTENENLPGFITLSPPLQFGAQNFGSAFLPAVYQGTMLRRGSSPLLHLQPPAGVDSARQRRTIDLIQQMNRADLDPKDTELSARIASYELAYRMQQAAPEAVDLTRETEATRRAYGLEDARTQDFGTRLLLARRLVERGVRFVQVYSGGGPLVTQWDAHDDMNANHEKMCGHVDQPIAALLKDLKSRGMLDRTLVVWATEFGRLPTSQGGKGRDHNPYGFTMWMAGGGFKGGLGYGATDEFGLYGAENQVTVNDFHANILHALGMDHEKLTVLHSGRDERLTDVGGRVFPELFR